MIFRDLLLFLGGLGELTKQVSVAVIKPKGIEFQLLREQVFQVGYRSLPLVLITAISTGMVMALQYGLGLERFGGTIYTPRLVTVTILREMGPVFTALMMAARVGAGIASEIGSMVVTQQIDAIRALGTSPIKKIVIPRVIACLVALPLLVGIANFVAFSGGLIIGVSELRLDAQFYILKAINNLSMMDYFSGFGKSFFFALCIAIPACYFGLNVKDGTRGVGLATTKAVVTASIFIFIGDFLLSKFFWAVESGLN